jgi:6-phosphogluconolactonase
LIHKAEKQKKILEVALSGGNTPILFFDKLGKTGSKISWQNIHFYWVDERCVPPDHNESNFGMVKKYLFDKIDIPAWNLHRIHGENDPISETEHYGKHIRQCISRHEGIYPIFDWILLGLGEDGHTASIFPGDLPVIQSTEICTVAAHPQTGQKRITLTLPAINLADRITFLVSGQQKAKIVAEILNNEDSKMTYPPAMIQSKKNAVEWYLDKEAATLL